MENKAEWQIVNPEGTVPVRETKINPHPTSLEGKTVVLHWNGKHNANVFLDRIADLLTEKVKGLKVVKGWEADTHTKMISGRPEVSLSTAQKLARLKPDLVIGASAD